jgi:hypothetical protein
LCILFVDEFFRPVKEKMEGMGGKFTKINKIYRKTMTVAEFEKLATSHEYRNPKPNIDLVELERYLSIEFWSYCGSGWGSSQGQKSKFFLK